MTRPCSIATGSRRSDIHEFDAEMSPPFLSIQAITASEWMSLSAPTAIVLPLRSAASFIGESLVTNSDAIGARDRTCRPA